MADPNLPDNAIDDVRKLRESFEAAWAAGHAEPIERLLPEPGDPRYLATLETLVLAEIECRWIAWAASAAPGAETVSGPPPVEVYLKRFPPLNRPEIIVRLIEQECHLRKRHGQPVTLDEYRRRFPGLFEPGGPSESILRGSIDTPEQFAMSATAALARPTVETLRAAAPRGPTLGRFGNYELLGELGRGGMGVVYQARQFGANRIVALKVIRRDRLEALPRDSQTSALDRFRNEAQAAARLEHDNIVTVYEVGEVDGEQFFSMRYVEGQSLAELLRHGPLESRSAAGYIGPVARAVHEAHLRGILHRDLKPQNILIDTKTDRALVADFGLAKLSEGAEELTRAGEVMGTPPYMSPEQARDSTQVTALTDVYALGATLYHVVTGRPPFQAATPVETLRQVMDEEPVPPRQLNPSIDRDLETICLKCLQKEPPRRYESALTLAEDLGRYLRGEPILARPVGGLERLVRWCRRNPIMAGLWGTAALLLVAVVVAITVGYVQTTAALAQARERERQTREAIDNFFTRVSEDTLLNQPGMQPLRKDLLGMALDHYERLIEEHKDDPTLGGELGTAYFNLGQIMELTESPEKAMPYYQQARQMQEELVAQRADDTGRLQALGKTLNFIGRALQRQKKPVAARNAYEEAVAVRQRLVDLDPDEGEFQRVLANSYMNLGIADREGRYFDEARRSLEGAQSLRLKALDAGFDTPELQRDLGMGYYHLALCRGSVGDVAAAEKNFGRAVEVFRRLLKSDAKDMANQSNLIICCRQLADLIWRKDWTAALELYQDALGRMETLARTNPDVPDYQVDLAGLHMNVGESHRARKELDAALASYRQAREILQALVEAYPKVARYRFDLVRAFHQAAVAELETGQAESALADLHAAKDQLGVLIQESPATPDYRVELARVKINLARLCRKQNRPEAIDAYRQAVEILDLLLKDRPQDVPYRLLAVYALEGMADLQRDDRKAAGSSLEAAVKHLRAVLDKLPAGAAKRKDCEDALKRIEKRLGELGSGPPKGK
jgi:tetratricopeptide (TPR) repeat protein/tRNA A-37 threonylcarbamoyl transferase component Bud32